MFTWKDKIIAMRSIPPTPKSTKEKEPKFIFICNRGEFLVESKETKQRFELVVEEVTPPVELLKSMRPLLEEFKRVMHDELPEELPPMRDIPERYTASQ